MSLTYPIVCQKNDGKYYIDFYLNKKRYRLFNAKKIGIDYKPNNYPVNKRQKQQTVSKDGVRPFNKKIPVWGV